MPMKTPTQWLDQFTAQEGAYDRPTAEANIKAIQDEAFKAGMRKAASVVNTFTAKQEILAELEEP